MTEYLEEAGQKYPDLKSTFDDFIKWYSNKLWHELTLGVLSFVSDPKNMRDGNSNFVQVYNYFVSQFDGKVNQLSLAKIAMKVAESYGDDDLVSRQSLIEGLLEKRARLGPEASLYLDMGLCQTLIRRGENLTSVKKTLSTAKTVLDTLSGSNDTSCHSSYYKTANEYHKVEGPPELFYKNALMYLSYTDEKTMGESERYVLATDVSLAALTGDGVYNFGEVVATPVLQYLKDTPNAWLMEFMLAFSTGDVNAFNNITTASKAAIKSQPALFSRLEFVNEKIRLLALVNMVFERSAADRNISFDEISARAQVPSDQVEWLVMRALSLTLIKGSIDQVDQVVTVDWVLPRVLADEQIKALADRLGEWKGKVHEMQNFVTDNTVELLYS